MKNNTITSAKFISSVVSLKACPAGALPEIAFIGRSNVGKSSLINGLLQRKNLAKTSSTPGKTQTINHYLINERFYLVDLPGYGYARIKVDKQQVWKQFVNEYILKRTQLQLIFVLVDSSIPPQSIDIKFINFLGLNGVPFQILFTKTDRLSKAKLSNHLDAYKSTLAQWWQEIPNILPVSAHKKAGLDALLSQIIELTV